jgi:hypothetical protein
MAKTHMKKMLSVPGHKGNINQNHVKIPSYSCYNGYIIKNTNNKCWRGYGGKEPLHTVVGNGNGNQYEGSSKKLKIELPYDPAIPLLGINTQRNVSQVTIKTPALPCLLQHYSQKPSYGNSQDAPLLMKRLRKCATYIQWNFIHP